jgi:hypothetical protein
MPWRPSARLALRMTKSIRFLLMRTTHCTADDAGYSFMMHRNISLQKQHKYFFPPLRNSFTLTLIAVRHN